MPARKNTSDIAQQTASSVAPDGHAIPVAEAGGILTVDLGAIEANWRKLHSMAISADCAAVVKANAYGCGLEPVVTQLAKAGCKTFFVADLAEGKRARKIASRANIYVLGGLPPRSADVFAAHNLRPVIGSGLELAEWDSFVSASNWQGGIAMHIDTGMNRLGLSIEEARSLAPRIKSKNHGIMLLMSHFVASQWPEHARNREQMDVFRDIRGLYRGVPASIANSSGVFLGWQAHLDLVRPGAALYGVNPIPGNPNPMQPVVNLKARVILTRNIATADTLGYDASWTARRPSRIAVLAVGYADGYFRRAGGTDQKSGGFVLAHGQRCPIVGRISMDLMDIDITDLPENAIRRGDTVTLIGGDLDVDALAETFDTNGYEVLTSLGQRYARLYPGGKDE